MKDGNYDLDMTMEYLYNYVFMLQRAFVNTERQNFRLLSLFNKIRETAEEIEDV